MHGLNSACQEKLWRDSLYKYLPIIFVLLIFLGLVIPATLRPYYYDLEHGTQQGNDMLGVHLPQVDTFITRPFAVFDYAATAAMTPGHHIALAWFARLLGYSNVTDAAYPIRLANVLFGVAVIVVAWSTFYARARLGWHAAILAAPLAFSSYVLLATIWVASDNGALLWYELVVAIAASNLALPLTTVLVCSALVLWRQIYLPVTGIFVLSWLAQKRTLASLPLPLLAAMMPATIIGIYYWHWHGFVPPVAQNFNALHFQFATPLSALALIGLILPFYFAYLNSSIRNILRLRPRLILGTIFVVAAAWSLGPTDHNVEQGRWGSVIWTIALHTPALGSYSFAVLCLAAIGAVTLISMLAESLPWGKHSAATVCLILYLVGYSMQLQAFQRYIEPAILFTYGYWVSGENNGTARPWVGPLLLAAILAVLSAFRAYGLLPQLFS